MADTQARLEVSVQVSSNDNARQEQHDTVSLQVDSGVSLVTRAYVVSNDEHPPHPEKKRKILEAIF